MRILAIRGCNLASLEGEFTIDFTSEPLQSAGIYAISGPTGSGKSTLLDAMCLALFGRTPRTEQAKESNVKVKDVKEDMLSQGDPRFLLRRGCANGYAEVDFMALNGQRYRSRWSLARARNSENGRLKSATITLYNIDTDRDEQGTNKELQSKIVELIGLTFEQFTRSVLLAQNDFSTFLKAEQSDKASLLEKLTGTERYSEISRLIYAKNSEAKAAYENLNASVKGIEILGEEELISMRDQLQQTERLNSELDKAKMERQSLIESVVMVKRQIEAKTKQANEVAASLERAKRLLEQSAAEQKQGEERLALCEEQGKQLRSQLQEARRLDTQLELAVRANRESEETLKEVTRRKREAEIKLKNIEERVRLAKVEHEKLLAWRERYSSKERIAEQHTLLLVRLDQCMEIRQMADQIAKRLVTLREKSAANEASKASLLREAESNGNSLERIEKDKIEIERGIKELEAESLDSAIEASIKERESLLVEQARFSATGDIKTLRDKLVSGTPCPVCGSVTHPFASKEAHERILVLADMIAKATLMINNLHKRRECLLEYRKRLEILAKEELDLQKLVATNANMLTESKNKTQAILEQIEREERDSRDQKERLDISLKSVNELFGNDKWQSSWLSDPVSFRQRLSDFAEEWKRNMERTIQVERDISTIQAELESYGAFLPPLRRQYDELYKAHEAKSLQLSALSAERKALFEGKPADEVEREFNDRVDRLKEEISRMRESAVKHTAELEQYRGVSDQINRDQVELSEERAKRDGELERWKVSFKEQYVGKELDELLAECSARRSELIYRLRTDDDNRRKLASFMDELEKLKSVSERWSKLNELAGSADGAKFRRIAQGYTLDLLLGYANVQLRQLSRRYRLERVPETLALQVIDRDMCDEVRTVHSLSGGESFLVSLALALGLSSLSSNRMRVESLFIDEGFGSLDAETLRMAMDALESLRTQGRKIGVISHVQEMTERIPVQIRVNRSGNGKSEVSVIG